MLYRLLKLIIGLGIKLYYRKIKVNNAHVLEKSGPKIIIANHPNTLMDAWLLTQICKEPIFYMAKGTFFNSPLKRLILNSLGLIPVNRAVDSKISGVSNEDSFSKCYELLEKGKSLVIFPEGNSFQERMLRKLKSGTARIALETEKRNDGKLGLLIVPVGLIYLEASKFRSAVVANVGEPISPLTYLEMFKSDSLKAARKLTEEFKNGLSQLLINSDSKEQETLADQVIELLASPYKRGSSNEVEDEIDEMKTVYNRLNQLYSTDIQLIERVKKLVWLINWQTEKLEINAKFLDRNFRFSMFFRQLLQSIIGMIIGLPLFLFGYIHNILPFRLTDVLVPKIVSDVEYYAPLAVLIGLIVYPLNYLMFGYIVNVYIPLEWYWELVYLISMMLGGLFAYYYYHYYHHISLKLNFIFSMRNEIDAVNSIKEKRNELRSIIYSEN